MTKFVPSNCPMRAAIIRAEPSALPPATNPTSSRIGLPGYLLSAATAIAVHSSPIAHKTRRAEKRSAFRRMICTILVGQ